MWSVGCLTTHAVSGAAVPRLPYGQARLALTSQGHLWAPQPTCGIQTALPNVLSRRGRASAPASPRAARSGMGTVHLQSLHEEKTL